MNLHGFRDEVKKFYNGVLVGFMVVRKNVRKTNISFINFKEFENYIFSLVEIVYEIDDSIFTECIYKLETPVFNLVNRSGYGKTTDYKRVIFEVIADNCYMLTSKYRFIKCIIFSTGKNFKQKFLEFIRNQLRRTHVLTQARIQAFVWSDSINIDYHIGKDLFPRSFTERKRALSLYNNYFCLIRESECVIFKKAVKEIKSNFKVVDNYIKIDILLVFLNIHTNLKKWKTN